MSFYVGECPCQPDCISNVQSNIGPTSCSFVANGFCPAGYYCPFYTPALLEQSFIQSVLTSNNCVFGQGALDVTQQSLLVVCPCTPGFFW